MDGRVPGLPAGSREPLPGSLEDCLDAYAWLTRTASEFGIDPGMIAVGGDSAGGNLAAALCLHRRDERSPLPATQVLAYPAVDGTFTTRRGRNSPMRRY